MISHQSTKLLRLTIAINKENVVYMCVCELLLNYLLYYFIVAYEIRYYINLKMLTHSWTPHKNNVEANSEDTSIDLRCFATARVRDQSSWSTGFWPQDRTPFQRFEVLSCSFWNLTISDLYRTLPKPVNSTWSGVLPFPLLKGWTRAWYNLALL